MTGSVARSRRHSVMWWIVMVLSSIVVLYGSLYLILQEKMFPPDLAESFKARPWGIYPHVIVGMLGLTLGPLQFHPSVQARAATHRRIGITYVVIAMLVGIIGMYMSLYSAGGMITHTGFGMLGAALFVTTLIAYRTALRGEYASHREWMIRSYSFMFAAPTLRLWLTPLIIAYQGEFIPAYRLVAWLSWVPNIIFAEWYIRHTRGRVLQFGGRPLDGAR